MLQRQSSASCGNIHFFNILEAIVEPRPHAELSAMADRNPQG
jgi:hypothetical protein